MNHKQIFDKITTIQAALDLLVSELKSYPSNLVCDQEEQEEMDDYFRSPSKWVDRQVSPEYRSAWNNAAKMEREACCQILINADANSKSAAFALREMRARAHK